MTNVLRSGELSVFMIACERHSLLEIWAGGLQTTQARVRLVENANVLSLV